MTGVEILAMEEVVTAYAFNLKVYLLFIFGSIVLCSLIALLTAITSDCEIIYGLKVGLIFGVIIGVLIGLLPAWTTLPSEYENEYKVTISDEVQMNDFLSRYEIIDQEGRIYTVREISNE